jgi:hypothetical protein
MSIRDGILEFYAILKPLITILNMTELGFIHKFRPERFRNTDSWSRFFVSILWLSFGPDWRAQLKQGQVFVQKILKTSNSSSKKTLVQNRRIRLSVSSECLEKFLILEIY